MIQNFTRQTLESVLGISRSSVYRFLKSIDAELKQKFPKHHPTRRIIPNEVFYWICNEYGFDKDIVFARLMITYHKLSNENIEMIKNCYGANGANCFIK